MMWMLLACQGFPEFVTISGTVFDGQEGESPVAGALIDVFDVAMESVDSVETDADGDFSAQARYGSYYFLSLSAEGFVTTGISGSVGPSDFAIPEGALWLRSSEDHEAFLTEFDGCEGIRDDGVLEGEILMALPAEDGLAKMYVETGWARAILSDGTEIEACYLGEEGEFDSSAEYTGPTGRFAIPGVSGKMILRVGYDLGDATMFEGLYTIFVPENGVTTLYDSLWMPLPQ